LPAANKRFGATAAGRADLKGSAEMSPLRQAVIPLQNPALFEHWRLVHP